MEGTNGSTNKKLGVIKMKIVIPAVEIGSFETEIHENFGRANYFALVDTANDEIEFIDNSAADQSSGAGVGAAQLCADNEADIVAAYHFGPKAYKALTAAGIKILDLTDQKLIQEAYNDYQAGKLAEAEAGPGGHH
ncbi:MAG: dinitrogenase iron-molybdenum cofactor biosynthesis protein [Halanaerobium sp. 4-GBenrich]|jgi:predicted Fe-Mo cluster-binding NifX family protein|uniref:Predicted Fe-Mo cluster-binding protein, NifX family n=2 Tax=Halanaerobium congolense TaxID=54121 RepID=A0A1G6RZ61_9FIRM|nr:MAG: dinitrogenase iron-molybdenum cofactor biosynthesis protein [Halanaerobium sp. T82-1]ODS50418.1 MAG: dinitrogenase iron-molybdenum cofactor biosynthesis protein [Halanaerobium sp. 4-GBenrich]PTX17886.1 putative Fe-Mo cluster-binding NifX family protein [Halanaerobium congolense]PUU92630.1 MAG: dinitrogenase iron-molybdenum cofactor biosynthesis protein [Halanaerobium sp.]PXV67950.1 putative Fe-Mo cluster-binding NifX family protein [Halanaerobium congolense]